MSEALRDRLIELNEAAYTAAKAARKADPQSPLAARLKALALETDAILDGVQ